MSGMSSESDDSYTARRGPRGVHGVQPVTPRSVQRGIRHNGVIALLVLTLLVAACATDPQPREPQPDHSRTAPDAPPPSDPPTVAESTQEDAATTDLEDPDGKDSSAPRVALLPDDDVLASTEDLPGTAAQDALIDAGITPAPRVSFVARADARADAHELELRRHTVETALAALSLEQRVGQLFMPAFPVTEQGLRLLTLDNRARAAMRRMQPGGVLLLGLNVAGTEQLTRLITELQQEASLPLLISIDQEGGAISRLDARGAIPATRIPSPHIVGAVADRDLAERLGEVIGRELRSLGIHINFAPVADLRTNPANTVIGNRSLGSDPETVGRLVAALVGGMQRERVAAVLKHFPGHGDTYTDSHYESAAVTHDLERLRTVELVPFRHGINAGAAGVMSGHIGVPEVTGDAVPATLSPRLVRGLLREELQFDALVFSDALNMHALTRYFHRSQLAVDAIEAGIDVLVHPERPVEAFEAVLRAVEDGRLDLERIEQSVRRILMLKYDLGLLQPQPNPVPAGNHSVHGDANRHAANTGDITSILGAPEHRAVAEEILRRYRKLENHGTDEQP